MSRDWRVTAEQHAAALAAHDRLRELLREARPLAKALIDYGRSYDPTLAGIALVGEAVVSATERAELAADTPGHRRTQAIWERQDALNRRRARLAEIDSEFARARSDARRSAIAADRARVAGEVLALETEMGQLEASR